MAVSRRVLLSMLVLAGVSACSLRNVACGVTPPASETQAGPAVAEPTSDQSAPSAVRIVFLGDSLTAGLGLLTEQAYPHLIQEMFAAEGYDEIEAVNAGISGDTTAGGARRVDGILDGQTRILVVALGGNDALRGLTTEQTYSNLSSIITTARGKGVSVLLAGMEAPTNLGEDYRLAFRSVFIRLTSEFRKDITFVPFLLEGVAMNPALNQPDGIHPNPEGAKVIANLLYPKLRMMIDSLGNGGG